MKICTIIIVYGSLSAPLIETLKLNTLLCIHQLLLFTNNTHVTHLSLVKHVCKVSHTSHIRHTHTRHTHNTHHTPLCHTRHTYDTHITHTTHLCTSLTHRCVTVCAVILEWTAGVVGTDDSSSSPLHSQALWLAVWCRHVWNMAIFQLMFYSNI